MSKWIYDAQQRTGRLVIDDGLTVAHASQARERLLQGFAEAERLVCDLSAVVEVDVAGLQLLYAARRYAETHGKILVLAGCSPAVAGLARQAGFARILAGTAATGG